jgi:hypothetical protein
MPKFSRLKSFKPFFRVARKSALKFYGRFKREKNHPKGFQYQDQGSILRMPRIGFSEQNFDTRRRKGMAKK